mgnify:CR=1 FL=1
MKLVEAWIEIHKEDFTKVAKDILKSKPDVIGFSTWCITYPASLLIAQEIKNLAPKIPIVYGFNVKRAE